MKTKSPFAIVIAAAVLLVLSESPAYAYLDPGAGSLLLQTLVAGVLGGLYAVKHFWRRITGAAGAVLARLSRRG